MYCALLLLLTAAAASVLDLGARDIFLVNETWALDPVLSDHPFYVYRSQLTNFSATFVVDQEGKVRGTVHAIHGILHFRDNELVNATVDTRDVVLDPPSSLRPVLFDTLQQYDGDSNCAKGLLSADGRLCCPSPSCSGEVAKGRPCAVYRAPCDMVVEQTVHVEYTPAALAWAKGDIVSVITLAIAETNLAYAQSLIPITLKLADAPVQNKVVVENGDPQAILESFRPIGASADMNVLLMSSPASCGIAYLDCSLRPSLCYAAVRVDCATGYYSFGHELGHLQGANHNMEAMPYGRDNLDNHGLVITMGYGFEGAYRTVMAYSLVDETRIPYFSNPSVKVNGKATGILGAANNARVITESRYRIARFEWNGPINTLSPSPSPTPAPTRSPTPAPTKSPSAFPTRKLTINPSLRQSNPPSILPSPAPSSSPSDNPSRPPTFVPSPSPTPAPTKSPSAFPTRKPTRNPSLRPSKPPSRPPSTGPSSSPYSANPSRHPSSSPSDNPSRPPSSSPSASPSQKETRPPSPRVYTRFPSVYFV